MTNAHAEVLTLKNENDSSIFENANNKTSTTTSNTAIENNLDNKTISQQEFLELEQIDDDKVGTDNSSVSPGNTNQTKELALTEFDGSLSHGTVTIEAKKNSDFQSPPIARYIENEGLGLTPIEYQNNYEGFSSNKNDDHESKDRNSNENDDSKELLESNSGYYDYLQMQKNIKKDAEQNKENEARDTGEIPKDNQKLDTEAKEEDEEEEELHEERLNGDIMANKKQTLNDNNKLLSNTSSTEKLNDKQRYGAPIDNENKKLLSQFMKADSSIVVPDLQIQSGKSNATIKDGKLVANAGLDQILRDETRIVLDASSSFSSNGNISNFLWKQLGDSEEKIKPSNSMIYSFPIPEDIESNTLEFELTVMDKKGQKASDTVKILLADEQYQVDNNSDVEEESENEQPQIQAVDEVNNQDDNEIEEEEEEEEDDNEEEEEEDDNEEEEEEDDNEEE
ncbi:MAG TPA: hypothetical protein VFT83_02535 [Nitrososphaeraceae archaeon]|nr:hypothetical protein [Nitrososphaeraceae archaeon]